MPFFVWVSETLRLVVEEFYPPVFDVRLYRWLPGFTFSISVDKF
jgi:hypothetical protein